ncbi:MAG TPA: cytochrome c biogenesis protein CcsA [Saprospiraceae bacterium]|nr:cytochrome c biogenesis protein CcsA [Saprospiraceae bacterium]
MQNVNQPSKFKLAAWKWASMVILLYVFIAGWFVPLNPGIIKVDPGRANAGDSITVKVEGYNTSFAFSQTAKSTDPDPGVRAWLRLKEDTVLAAYDVLVVDDRNLEASFYIPSALPFIREAYPLTLVLDHPVDGSSVLPNALFITPNANPDPTELALWTKDKISGVHTKAGIQYPFRNILAETIRNTYFHVPMWFAMIILFGISAWYSLKYYRKGNMADDAQSLSFIKVGLIFGLLGMVTGMLWAKFTWNAYWSWDVKQNMAAIALLIYAALMVLRSSVEDNMQKARLTAGYNMFAFILLIPLLFIIPRMTDSLHPGNGGNPAMGGEDLDNTMRMVFYPAVIGWIMLGVWISQLVFRVERLKATAWS